MPFAEVSVLRRCVQIELHSQGRAALPGQVGTIQGLAPQDVRHEKALAIDEVPLGGHLGRRRVVLKDLNPVALADFPVLEGCDDRLRSRLAQGDVEDRQRGLRGERTRDRVEVSR